MSERRMNALVLAGGKSRRMGTDKAAVEIDGQRMLDRVFALATEFCDSCRVSVRPDQMDDPLRARFNPLPDTRPGEGPLAGVLAAFESDPKADWLVLACDMPGLTRDALQLLTEAASQHNTAPAVALASPDSSLPEPLCAVWRREMRDAIIEALDAERRCARKVLINAGATVIPAHSSRVVANMNTPSDLDAWRGATL